MTLWHSLYQIVGKGLAPLLSRLPEVRRGYLPGPVDLWVHASSVGEATVAAAILTEFLKEHPQVRVLLTLFTETGLTKARDLLGGTGVKTSLAPYDLPEFVTRALENVRPRVLALVETELWPNLIAFARARGTRVVLLNGRLSLKSFPRYRCLKGFFRPLLEGLAGLAVIGPKEAERFKASEPPRSVFKSWETPNTTWLRNGPNLGMILLCVSVLGSTEKGSLSLGAYVLEKRARW